MKRIIISLMTVMATLQLHAQDQNFWIFLCFGQSNMAGQAPIEEQDLNISDRYLSMATTDGPDRKLGTWRKAVPPLCRADAHLGPADWFGRTLIDVVPENVKIGIVSVAVEGCPITFFDKDQNAPLIAKEERDWMNGILDQYGRDPYERLLSMAKIAAKDGVIKGILLHQGETDAYNDQWRKTLRKIYRDLQQELRFDSTAVPLLVGEVVRGEYGGICGHANPTINDIANHYPNTYVVSSEGCLPSDDNLHFSSEGYRLLGRHYALRYLEATNPQLAEVCRQKFAAAGLDQGGTVSSKLTVDTKRSGTTLSIVASEPVEKVDVVSFSGQTVKTFTISGKKAFDLSLKDLPKEKLVLVFQSAEGKATTDIDLTKGSINMTNAELRNKVAKALDEMKAKAVEMGIQGVATASVLNQGETVDWIGEMKVVGTPLDTKGGYNLVAVAWSKCGEVIATGADSGNPNHQTMTGELGYAGGAYGEFDGFKMAFAFSGATSEEDLVVAKYGIEKMKCYIAGKSEAETTATFKPLTTPLKKEQFIQVTIVVNDIRKAAKAWAALLNVPEPEIWTNHLEGNSEYPYTYRGQGDKSCDLQMCVIEMGDWVLELHQIDDNPSTFREFINKHGQGVHHLGFEVGDARGEVIRQLKELGFDTDRTIGVYPGSSRTIVDSEDVLGVNLNIKPKR